MKKIFFTALCCIQISTFCFSQQKIDSSKYPHTAMFTAQQDHNNMMQQLGIKQFRPDPSGNPNAPNHANYNELLTNPCPVLPDILTTKKGKKITTAELCWKERRSEIVEDFERKVYGHIPRNVPKEKMPAVLIGLLDGQLAWHQHDGGHTDAPNFKYFISWANKFSNYTKHSST